MIFNVNLDSLVMRKNKSVTGHIYVTIEGQDFPERVWDDFVIDVLGDWTPRLTDLFLKKTDICMCRFADGPFWIEVLDVFNNNWRIRYVDGRGEGKIVIEKEYNSSIVLSDLLNVSVKVIDVCKKNNWSSNDIDFLIKQHNKLKKILKSKGIGVHHHGRRAQQKPAISFGSQ